MLRRAKRREVVDAFIPVNKHAKKHFLQHEFCRRIEPPERPNSGRVQPAQGPKPFRRARRKR